MKLIKGIFFLILLLSFFVSSKPVFAQSCEVNLTRPFVRGGTNNICIGGFNNEQELRSYRLDVWCERASLTIDPNSPTFLCRSTTGRLQSVDLSSVTQIGAGSGGTVFTCFDLVGIEPRVHQVTFNVVNKSSGQTSCSTGGFVYNEGDQACPNGICDTALGPINTRNFSESLKQFFTIAIGIGGGLALLLMAYGVFIITTSAGIPDKVNEGKNIITAAAGGLIFIVLSVVVFRIVGVDILGIPGIQ